MLGNKKVLFVAGTPRSGTTAMVALLNCHTAVLMLNERYSYVILRDEGIGPEHFVKERLFTFNANDSYYDAVGTESGRELLQSRYSSAVYVGDKVPRLYERLDRISTSFEFSTVIFLSRNIIDVSSSYNRRARNSDDKRWPSHNDFRVAVHDWNMSNRLIYKAIQDYRNIDVVCVDYEKLFSHTFYYRKLLARLRLPCNVDLIDDSHLSRLYRHAEQLEMRRSDGLQAAERRFICMNADFLAYRAIHSSGEWVG
jgi:hypothetical protein